jgi:hypothetical protein
MRRWLVPLSALLGLALALVPACRKGDGTTPSPRGPIQPSAAASK